MTIKCAEIFWNAEHRWLAYRCVFCQLGFETHLDCVQHLVQPCEQSPHRVVLSSNNKTADMPMNSSEYIIETLSVHEEEPDLKAEDNPDDEFDIIEMLSESDTEEAHQIVVEYPPYESLTSSSNQPAENDDDADDCSPETGQVVVFAPAAASVNDAPPRKRYPRYPNFSTILLQHLKAVARAANPNGCGDFIECDICGERLGCRNTTYKHMQRVHIAPATAAATTTTGPSSAADELPDQPAPAPPPPRHATGLSLMVYNRKYYPQPRLFCCEICGTRMSDMGNLRRHMRIHTGEKPFPCDFCPRRFTATTERTIHMRTHTGERPFACPLCERAFSDKNHLRVHQLTIHNDARPFACDQCERTFKRRSSFKKHQLTHTGERPYGCETCGKRFRQRNAFQVHQNIHTGNRPFRCGHCERGFHSTAARRSHEKIFHRVP